MECNTGAVALGDVLTKKQIQCILSQAVGDGWQLVRTEISRASPGLAGFQGDHFRITFEVNVADSSRKINIFVKSLPVTNEPKAKFIDDNNFYRREMILYQLIREIQAGADDSDAWCANAYICSDKILVMPDLKYRGYRQHPLHDYLDLKHALLASAAIARFHAAFANYETKRNLTGQLPFNQEYADLLKEPIFIDSPWLRAAAKLTKNFLTIFSNKCSKYPANLEDILVKLYKAACDSLTESKSLNVVIHKDLWVNNILFKYQGDTPINALLIDFQCVRYSPPAFDLMAFLYLNTSKTFRERYESTILRQYFIIFAENLDNKTKERLQLLGYDFDEFVSWCHKARMFGMFEAIGEFPYTLMEPSTAQKAFDDPETFMTRCNDDRTEPVVDYAKKCEPYRERQLEVCEEFVERYVLKQLK